LVLLQLMRLLRQQPTVQIRLLLGAGGPLLAEYEQLAPVTIWPANDPFVINPVADKVLAKLGRWEQARQRKTERRQQAMNQMLGLADVDVVLVNTVSSSEWFGQLHLSDDVRVITFVHELAMSVRMYSDSDALANLFRRTNHVLAVSEATANYYVQQHGVNRNKITLFTLIDTPTLQQNITLAQEKPSPFPALGIPENAVIVGGCGNAEWRKGNDLFVTLAKMVMARNTLLPSGGETQNIVPMVHQSLHFVWVGMPPGSYRDDLWLDVQKAGLTDRVHFVEPTPEVLRYSTRFSIFALTSREDPYPLVVLEAGLSAVPVVCFAGAGGSPELVETDGGAVVPYLDLSAMTNQILALAADPDKRHALGQRLREKVLARHPAEQSVAVLMKLLV
jgi:glycosyltransferase involved in cell wall biosynthesis